MKQHEREYFVSQIRAGVSIVSKGEIRLKIVNPTFDQCLEACSVYQQAYHEAYQEEVMCLDEIEEWMIEHNLWSQEDEDKIEGLRKDLERLKVEIYNNRHNEAICRQIRMGLRAGERQLTETHMKKMAYFSNTREGIAETEKARWLTENCTYRNGDLYDFAHVSVDYVLSLYKDTMLDPKDTRDLARNEPWKSIWITSKGTGSPLFANVDTRELNENQRNVVLWSQMYDNIQESLECPTDDVIKDDDMLDGWFIVQRKNREKDKAENDFESGTKSDKIKNAGEVYVMAGSDKARERVEGMNNVVGKMQIKEREALLKRKHGQGVGKVKAGQFMDEQLKMRAQSNQMYKNKFGG